MASPSLIAVSGSTGLVGKALIQGLSSDISVVHRITSSTIDIGDIRGEVEVSARSGATYFLHLGWPASSSKEDYRTSRRNYDALEKTILLRQACREFKIHFVGVGSAVDHLPIHPNPYSLTKYLARMIFLEDIVDGQMSWVRPFYIFDESTWPHFLHRREQGESSIIIHNDQPRDFIHLSDVTQGIEAIIREGIKGQIDLGCSELRRPSEICSALGIEYEVVADDIQTSHLVSEAAVMNTELCRVWSPNVTRSLLKGSNAG